MRILPKFQLSTLKEIFFYLYVKSDSDINFNQILFWHLVTVETYVEKKQGTK